MEDNSAVLGLLNKVGQVLAAEGRVTAEESVGDDTERPHVDGLAMSFLEHDFGCCVTEGSSHGLEHTIGAVEMFGNAEVCEHESRVVGLGKVQEVLGLQIWKSRQYEQDGRVNWRVETDRDGRHRSGGGSRRLPRLVLWWQKRPSR